MYAIRPKVKEQAQFHRYDAFGGLELLAADYIAHSFPRHAHAEFVIGVMQRGADVFHYNGSTHVAPEGTIFLINPGVVHDGRGADATGWAYRALYPTIAMIENVVAGMSGRGGGLIHFPDPVVLDPMLAEELLDVHADLLQENDSLAGQSNLLLTLARLIERHARDAPALTPPGRALEPVARARDYIHEHFARDVTLIELARVADLSPFWFIRAFQKHFGLTPHAYLIGLRVRHAKALLARGAAIIEVALDTGFADQSHLTRRFKSIVGVTPGQFVRQASRH